MRRSDVKVAAAVVGILVLAGVVAGAVWWWVAPQPTYRVAADGLYLVGDQPQEYVAADGWFALITALIGAGAGLLAWLRVRRAGLGVVIGLFVGGLAGAAVAAGVGLFLGRSDPYAAPLDSVTQGPLELRAWGVLLVEAGVALSVWLLLDLLVLRDERPSPPPDAAGVVPPEQPDYGAVRDL